MAVLIDAHHGRRRHVVGRLKSKPTVLVLAIGNDFAEVSEADCSPMRGGEPALGRAERQAYLKKNAGTLKP